MGQRYTFIYSWIILIAAAILYFPAHAQTADKTKADTVISLKSKASKGSYLKNGLGGGTIPVIKSSPYIDGIKSAPPKNDDKLLSNVQIYPNPITDQINLKYMISRNSNVSIKIMDVLGNNVATLFSERVEPGEKKFTYYLTNKLTSGFYFLRMVVGTESVIKRITIL